MALSVASPNCILSSSPVLGNATLADLAAFKKRGGSIYPFFFCRSSPASSSSSSPSSTLAQELLRLSHDSFVLQEISQSERTLLKEEEMKEEEEEEFELLDVSGEKKVSEEVASLPVVEEPVEEPVEDDEEYYSKYSLPDEDFEDDFTTDMDKEFGLEEEWERSNSWNFQKNQVTLRSKKSNKKEKITKRFVNACRQSAQVQRMQNLRLQWAEEQANSRRERDYAAAVRASLAAALPVPNRKTSTRSQLQQSRATSQHPNMVVGDIGLTLAQITALQGRELTPEDYELLLLLDASVPKKTLSKSLIDTFTTITLTANSEDLCCVCMCSYSAGEMLKELPCGHRFHQDCISTWLSTSSVNCPIDGLSLKD